MMTRAGTGSCLQRSFQGARNAGIRWGKNGPLRCGNSHTGEVNVPPVLGSAAISCAVGAATLVKSTLLGPEASGQEVCASRGARTVACAVEAVPLVTVVAAGRTVGSHLS